MLYVGLQPIAFDASGDFKTHRLSRMWLKKLGYTLQDNRYVLSGHTPQGDSFEAFYAKTGEFLFVRTDFWSKAISNQDPWLEIYLSHITRTVTAGGQEYLIEKNYQINEARDKNLSWQQNVEWPKDPESLMFSQASLQQEISDALKQQGLNFEASEIVVKLLKETRMSQLAPDDVATEIRTANNDGVLLYEHEDIEKNIFFKMPKVHHEFWKALHVR